MSTNPPDGQAPDDDALPGTPEATPPVAPPESSDPVIPPEPPTPPTSGRPAPPPPGYVAPGPVNPYLTPPTGAAGAQTPPAPPFATPQQGAPYYYPGAPSPAVQPRQGMGNGAKLGLGTGLGCLSYILAIPAAFALLPLISTAGAGWLFIFVIPALIGAALMLSPKSRRVGLGMLIIAAAAWLVVIGPCIAMLGGL